MKFMIHILFVILAFAIGLTSCGKSSEQTQSGATSDSTTNAKPSIAGTAESAMSKAAEVRDAYVAAADSLLGTVAEQLPDFKSRAASLPGPAKSAAEKTITSLETSYNTATETLAKVKGASVEDWQKLKPDMDSALKTVADGFDKVKSLF